MLKEQKDNIKQLVKKIVDYNEIVSFKTNEKNINKIIDIIRYDYVVSFHVGDVYYTYDYETKLVTLKPQYLIKKDDYELLMSKILAKLTDIKKEISILNNDLEKEMFIHDYLCENVKYHDDGNISHSIVGPLLYGRGVCEGISKTFHALCKVAKLESFVICGNAIDENNNYTAHAWNAIKLNNVYTLVDITADLPLYKKSGIRYDYFNLSKEDVGDLYIPIDSHVALYNKCVNNDYSFFKINNVLFDDTITALNYAKKNLITSKHIYIKINKGDLDDFIDIVKKQILKKTNFYRLDYSINKDLNIISLRIY